MAVSIGAGPQETSQRLRNTRGCIFARAKVEEGRRQEKPREKAGRAGVTSINAPLTKGAWFRGNNGWTRSYRVPLLGAIQASDFNPSYCTPVCSASPSVAAFN